MPLRCPRWRGGGPFSAAAANAVCGANVLTLWQVGGDTQWTNFDSHRLEVKVVPPLAGDCDDYGDADVEDAAAFLGCLSGPEPETLAAECPDVFDIDLDGDVDVPDCAGFQLVFGTR